WKAGGIDWRVEWKRAKEKVMPDRVKSWFLDALNNALRVCYHLPEVPCKLCGKEVHGRHFLGECSFTGKLQAFVASSDLRCTAEWEELCWLTWKAHCSRNPPVMTGLVQALKRLRVSMG